MCFGWEWERQRSWAQGQLKPKLDAATSLLKKEWWPLLMVLPRRAHGLPNGSAPPRPAPVGDVAQVAQQVGAQSKHLVGHAAACRAGAARRSTMSYKLRREHLPRLGSVRQRDQGDNKTQGWPSWPLSRLLFTAPHLQHSKVQALAPGRQESGGVRIPPARTLRRWATFSSSSRRSYSRVSCGNGSSGASPSTRVSRVARSLWEMDGCRKGAS